MELATRSLVEIAAAIAGGCTACLDAHFQDARRAGVSEGDIAEAVALGEATRRSVDATVLAAVQKAGGSLPVSVGDAGGCGCGSGGDC